MGCGAWVGAIHRAFSPRAANAESQGVGAKLGTPSPALAAHCPGLLAGGLRQYRPHSQLCPQGVWSRKEASSGRRLCGTLASGTREEAQPRSSWNSRRGQEPFGEARGCLRRPSFLTTARTRLLRFPSHYRKPRGTAELFLAHLFLFEESCANKQLPKTEVRSTP